MWFIWIMWVIVAIAIIATIILLTGKGSMLVSGFNTKSPEERAKYDKEKVSKQTGLLMIFVDVGLLALTSYIQFRAIPAIQNITISDYGTEITIVALGICAYIIVIGSVVINDKCKMLAKKVKEIIDTKSSFADWLNNQNVRNQLKLEIKICLAKNGYPPKYSPEVFRKVMEQVENFEENA